MTSSSSRDGLSRVGQLYQFARLDRRVAGGVATPAFPLSMPQRVADQCREARIITVPAGRGQQEPEDSSESVLRQMLEFNMGRGDLGRRRGRRRRGRPGGLCRFHLYAGHRLHQLPHHHPLDDRFLHRRQDRCGSGRDETSSAPSGSCKLVIVDPSTLATLPRRQYINGLAESVKASLLADPELFAIFEKGDIDEQIGEIIYRSLRFKKSIVEQDETEHGMRKALN